MTLLRRTLHDKGIWKDTRRIFWFATLSSIFGSLNLFIDSFVSGNLGTDVVDAIAVVALNAPLVLCINIVLEVATAGHISQSINSGKYEHAQKSFDFSLALTIISISIMGLILYGLETPFIEWRTSDTHIADLARQYYWFEMGAILIGTFTARFRDLLRAKGSQRRLTIITIITIATNGIASYLFAYVGDMGIIGTGLGTVISVCIGGFMRVFLVFNAREQMGIKAHPFRFVYAKFSQIKILRKTWVYLPYEFTYAAIIVGQSYIMTNIFEDGLTLIAISSGLCYSVTAASGASTMMSKFVSPLLGKGETEEAKLMTEKILVVSTIRQGLVSLVFVSIFGFALPYLHMYDTDHTTLVHAGFIVVGLGLTAGIMAPSFFTGYTLASLSANPWRVMFMDLGATAISLLVYYLGSLVSTSWVSIMMVQIIHRIIADVTMVSLVFRKDQYVSLKKEMA